VTKQLQIGSRSFVVKQLRALTVNMVSLKTKFEWGPLDRGLKLGWGGFRLLDAIFRKWCEVKLR